ncbi:sporulation protein [Stenotrophomonas sp. ESTM1D_MKCIP4_1]|uniref:SPOR domain-containing protein n=1 Tax=Stenotrophomonas sp. ESTM1D_MKCIP4_1 TaxID=2072414 RepID=UPI000D53CDF8|nr:SPOR domain-containing protein [Stenotrophomonas sp. ESTM1D_MKCIP4_1]AWH52447.1 sporulation protein [Stenotrophomonas sp. ESTM1D_MKCIP4_1]
MDTPLKQRLIGAIVLVALAVIFLPMLVKGPAPDSGVANVPLAAPDAPGDGQFETRELPLVAPAGGATGLQSGQARPVEEAAAPAAPPTVDTSPAVAAGNYAVTFGAYGSQADADAVIAYLKRSQLPGFSETASINGRPAWRVRVGPYADRAEAEAARLQAVKVRGDVKAEVITLDASTAPSTAVAATPSAPSASTPVAAPSPSTAGNPVHSESLPASTATVATPPAPKPEAPKPQPKPEPAKPKPEATASKPDAPATPAAPAASSVGFAVQLGAFGQANDANALRDKVRAAGFSAFVEQVRTEKGTLHRVRVGPVANRADAEQLKAQVAAKVGVAGMVRPHP